MRFNFPKYTNLPIKRLAQNAYTTNISPNFGDTTVINTNLLNDNLNALQNASNKIGTKQQIIFNKMLRYISDLITKSKDPNAIVAMASPTFDEIKSIIAFSPESPGVPINIIINILNNIRNNKITDNDRRILQNVKNKLL